MVNIEEFVDTSIGELESFVAQWLEQHQVENNMYPLELDTIGDWDEQFPIFRGRNKE